MALPELEPAADYSTENNPHKGNRGLTRAWHAAKNSWSGLVFAVREESAFRQELTLAACLIPLALILPFAAVERPDRRTRQLRRRGGHRPHLVRAPRLLTRD